MSRAGAAWVAIGLMLGLAGSVPVPRAASAQPSDAPEWVRTEEHREYPRDRYLLGTGAASRYDAGADAIREATANSRAAIARQIRSRVRQTITDSVVEVTTDGERRVDERVVRVTEVRTALQLKNARVVERWTDERTVYVLSVVDRKRAAERLNRRIERLERKLESRLRRIERLRDRDPLEAFLRLREARRLDRELSTRYQVLSGVTGHARRPPRSASRTEELARDVGDRLEVAVTVRRREEGNADGGADPYPKFAGLLERLGWTVRDVRPGPGASPPPDPRERPRRRTREAGLRYALEVEIESKITDRVEAGEASLIFARAGGRWELRDLEDREVALQSAYRFPEATKAADGEDPARAREVAVDELLRLMRADLQDELGSGPGAGY